MEQTDLDVLKTLRNAWAATLRQHGGAIDVPPFLLTFDATSDLVWINYATPIIDTDENAISDALPTVRAEFVKRSRTLRFEYFEALCEALPAVLTSAGLKLHLRMPAMACTAADCAGHDETHRVERLQADTSDETIATFLSVREAAFGPLSPSSIAEQIAEQRREWSRGVARSVLAYNGDDAAGVATLIGCGAVSELVGVGTAPAHRGRGIARAATAALVTDHFQSREALAVWLTAGNDTARDIYARIGFRFIGWQSTYVDKDWKESVLKT